MKLVCIGVGGTGAACIETLVQLGALGLFPDGWELVPVVIDPDQQHPRVAGMTNFLTSYTELRARAKAQILNDGQFLGVKILRDKRVNSLRPAVQENLFGLLGLANPRARPLARLFFQQSEIGLPESHEFANGYYGRANAGVCFFSDPKGKESMLESLRSHLKDQACVVILGSVFGGTGAAGLLHVARTIREDSQLRATPPKIAIVQLESYFAPDPSGVDAAADFVNLPETFERRTGAAYQFLSNLANNGTLPFDALYPLGVRNPAIFPPEWFRPDQQDNPHLFLEYLAALAARDFIMNPPPDGPATMMIRRVGAAPFGEPLETLRRLLYGAAVTYPILKNFVVPLLRNCGSEAVLAGHPWVHDLHAESGLSIKEIVEHFEGTVRLLTEVLGHAGILESHWRTEGMPDQPLPDGLEARVALMSEKTRGSFPAKFIPYMEQFDFRNILMRADPAAFFESYNRSSDGGLPVRALHRWVTEAMSLPEATGSPRPDTVTEYQLVQQEDPGRGQILGLSTISDDAFRLVDSRSGLLKLARAAWKSPPGAQRKASEYPSVWAPALVYREMLLASKAGDPVRYTHLGLLWVALMKLQNKHQPPVHAFGLDSLSLSGAFRDAIKSTCPLAYSQAVSTTWNVLALYNPAKTPTRDMAPSEDDILGFFYPETAVVVAPGLSSANAGMLQDLGHYVAGKRFPELLQARCYDWASVLQKSGVPNAEVHGSQFEMFLKSFNDEVHGELPGRDEMHSTFEGMDTAAPWIRQLYSTGA